MVLLVQSPAVAEEAVHLVAVFGVHFDLVILHQSLGVFLQTPPHVEPAAEAEVGGADGAAHLSYSLLIGSM